jgi:general secretion pathway protein G
MLNNRQQTEKMKLFKNKRRSAFTLVEMLLVLVILATLAAIVIPKMAGRSKQAQVTAAKTQINAVESALDAFEVDNGFYPKSLDYLFAAPTNSPNWKGPYLPKSIPNDPWGNPYVYECPGKHRPDSYDLWSAGPDQQPGTDDDITNWENK